MMDGVEVGRVNVAARACGVGIRAFELAIAYAQQRRSFGKPIAEHQAVAFRLADGYGAWGSPNPGYLGKLSGARLVSSSGTVLAAGTFTQ